MTITREEMVKRLSERSGYYQKDVRTLLQCMDDVVFEAMGEATLEDEVQMQIVTGIKLGCKIVESRERVNPKTQEPIIVGETTKPFTKFSQDFRLKLQEQYNNKKNG